MGAHGSVAYAPHNFFALVQMATTLVLCSPVVVRALFSWRKRMYETPKLEVLGTFRELTLNGGTPMPGDVSPYHRYVDG